MWIIGCDFHVRYQIVSALNTKTGESLECRLEHAGDQTQKFYATLPAPARVGIEASGSGRWFEYLLAELGHELWVGDPAEVRAAVVRQQKTDWRDARHLLRLLTENRFPRIWLPSPEQREIRRLLLHRDRLVKMRTGIRNQLQGLAANYGLRLGSRLWSEKGRRQLDALQLGPWA